MAARETIIDAFDRCIDRVNQGEAVDAVLQDYRQFANDLRPMLEAGLVLPRARFPAETVASAQQSLEPLIRETIVSVFGGGALGGTIGLLFLLLLGGVIVAIVFASSLRPGPSIVPVLPPAPSASAIAPSVTPAATLTPAPSASATVAPSITPSPASGVIVIEGAVESIDGNTITLFDRVVQLEDDDPRLTVLQVGDAVRVEGTLVENVIRVINLTFVNIVVIVEGDQVWRDDRCDVPPPPWAQGRASGWQQRCVGNPPSSNPGGDGNSGGGDDDDD